jgi:hypothetical protein
MSLFSTDYGFVPVAAIPVRESWQGGEAISRNFRRRRSSLLPITSCMAVAFSLQLHNINSSLQSVYVHAVLGGGGPRCQPLNSADCHALSVRRHSERVLAGGNGNGGRQLRPDGGGVCPSAGRQPAAATAERHWFPQRWILNFFRLYSYFVTLIVFIIFCLIHMFCITFGSLFKVFV